MERAVHSLHVARPSSLSQLIPPSLIVFGQWCYRATILKPLEPFLSPPLCKKRKSVSLKVCNKAAYVNYTCFGCINFSSCFINLVPKTIYGYRDKQTNNLPTLLFSAF